MIIEYDETEKVIPSGDIGYHAVGINSNRDCAGGRFPYFVFGEIYFDDLHICVVMSGRYDTGTNPEMSL
jgi:hypothetical protein